MARKTRRLINIASILIALVMLASASGRVKAYFLQEPQTSSNPAAREVEQHPASGGEGVKEEEAKESPKQEVFLWLNFLIIVVVFWYFIKKNLVPYLETRAASIREDMERSRKELEEANRRLAAVEKELIHMDREIAALRNAALQEANAERARIEEAAKRDAEKIVHAAEQEIQATAKVMRQELRAYAADLAIGLAEKKIQSSISPESERVIFRSFLQDLTEKSQNGSAKDNSHSRQGGA